MRGGSKIQRCESLLDTFLWMIKIEDKPKFKKQKFQFILNINWRLSDGILNKNLEVDLCATFCRRLAHFEEELQVENVFL